MCLRRDLTPTSLQGPTNKVCHKSGMTASGRQPVQGLRAPSVTGGGVRQRGVGDDVVVFTAGGGFDVVGGVDSDGGRWGHPTQGILCRFLRRRDRPGHGWNPTYLTCGRWPEFSTVPPLSRWVVIPVGLNLWQHVVAGGPGSFRCVGDWRVATVREPARPFL